MFRRLLLRLANRYLSFAQISGLYHHKEYEHKQEQHKQSLIIKDHAEKEILQFLKDKGANFQKELERQDFIAIKLEDNHTVFPNNLSMWMLRNAK